MTELNEFDNIQEPRVENNDEREQDGLQKVIKCISCLPCFPKYVPKPETPNIDEVNKLIEVILDL